MNGSPIEKELERIAQRAIDVAVRAGADDAEVLIQDGTELSVQVRLGEPERVQEAGSRALGLRVFKDRRRAATYTSDMRPAALDQFVRETVELAALAEPDELNTLPDRAELATRIPDLDLYDEATESMDTREALARAKRGEAAALAFDPRVTNSEGATWARVIGAMAFATSGGFLGSYRASYSSFHVAPVCDDADDKKRNGFWWTASCYLADLEDPEEVGIEAARRTIAQLGSRKVDTCEAPVVFDPEVARSIVGMVFSVANGSSFYRKSSYLLEREGTQVASDLVTIDDDPLIPRGPGSRPFDGDGLATRTNTVVGAGVLQTVLCDVYTARKLGRRSTGSAGRGLGGNPSPTASNLILRPGPGSREELLRQTDRGFYVTSMMGSGFNPVTGDFSRGAAGFWIEGGELAFPVSEVTVSANFDDLLKRIDIVANDLDMRSSTASPTLRVSHMTVGGR
jgi:PmbA protein